MRTKLSPEVRSVATTVDPAVGRSNVRFPESWPPAIRIAFRFCFVYFSVQLVERWWNYWNPARLLGELYPAGLPRVPGIYTLVIHRPLQWLGLDLELLWPWCERCSVQWLEMLWLGILSASLTAVWSLAERRTSHPRLHELLRVHLRYWLALAMWMYAWAKVAVPQFGVGQERLRLLTLLGDTGGSTFLWETMGFSTTFAVLTAIGELAAAVLLLNRRTTTLGALLVVIIMSVVTLLNQVNSGPGWLSWYYLVMGAFLLVPEVPRLVDLYVRNRPVVPRLERTALDRHWRPAIKGLAIAMFVVYVVNEQGVMPAHFRPLVPRGPVDGLYLIDVYERNGIIAPPRWDDSTRWKIVMIGTGESRELSASPDGFQIVYMPGNASDRLYDMRVDSAANSLVIRHAGYDSRDDLGELAGRLSYRRTGPREVELSGTFLDDTIFARLRRVYDEESTLRRGWRLRDDSYRSAP